MSKYPFEELEELLVNKICFIKEINRFPTDTITLIVEGKEIRLSVEWEYTEIY